MQRNFKKLVKEKYDLIISVGGDGTLNQISSELIGTNVAIGVIPAGSGNALDSILELKTT